MIPVVTRGIGVIAQALTAYHLIKLFNLVNYGSYAVYVFEINIMAILLSFGAISFNINSLINKNKKEFIVNTGLTIQFSIVFLFITSIYFLVKYGLSKISVLIIISIFFKILQNISYSGVLGEKGITQYNLYLNTQLVIFLAITFLPNINIFKLLLARIILIIISIILLKKYILEALPLIKRSNFTIKNFKTLINRSFYDFTNNLSNRYELIILSFFEKFEILVGLLSVFMQIGDSLINFFKTLAPKIQKLSLIAPKKAKQLHIITGVCVSNVLIVLLLTYNIWMQILKPELLIEKTKYAYWSITIILAIILWSLRFSLQSLNFNLFKYNMLSISLIAIVSIIAFILDYKFNIIVITRIVLFIILITYVTRILQKRTHKA